MSECQKKKKNELQYHSKSCYVCFYFHSKCIPDVSSAHTEPFHKKARTGFKSYKLAKAACSSLTTSSPWVSLSQPTRYHDLCFITLSTCYCVRPLNGLRYFWALSSEKIQYSLPTRYEAIFFVFDPLNLPWTWLTFSIPQELMLRVGYFAPLLLSNSARLFFCFSGYLDNSAGLNACLSVNWRKHAGTLQPFSRHCKISFGVWFLLRFNLCSFHLRKKNGLTA